MQQQINNATLIEHNESVDCLSESIIKEIEEKNDEQLKGMTKISDCDYQQNIGRSKETR